MSNKNSQLEETHTPQKKDKGKKERLYSFLRRRANGPKFQKEKIKSRVNVQNSPQIRHTLLEHAWSKKKKATWHFFFCIFYYISVNKDVLKLVYFSSRVFLIEKCDLKIEFSSLCFSRSKATQYCFMHFVC